MLAPQIKHDTVPDGKSGPWLRKPHNKNENQALALDPRCAACCTLIERLLEVERPGKWAGFTTPISVSEAEGYLKNYGGNVVPHLAKGEYGAGI